MFNLWWQKFVLWWVELRWGISYHKLIFTHVKNASRFAKYFLKGGYYEIV